MKSHDYALFQECNFVSGFRVYLVYNNIARKEGMLIVSMFDSF